MAGIQSLDIYIGAAIFGMFSGLGNIVGQWVWKTYIERHANKIKKMRLKKVKKWI